MSRLELLREHRQRILGCSLCPKMAGRPVPGPPIDSRVLLLGQAPGIHEERVGRPFGWTAGKTLFDWLARLGIDEPTFRQRVYISAVCRCFPGKTRGGGDRVPGRSEIESCSRYLEDEITLLGPDLLIPVGRLAISRALAFERLTDVIGQQHRIELYGHTMDAIPLPHPSGASTWHRTEPGKGLLDEALLLLSKHAALRAILPD